MKRRIKNSLCPNNRLLDLMKHAMNYQVYINKEDNSKTIPKNLSLLKDIVETKTYKKFSFEHLDNCNISFCKNNGSVMHGHINNDASEIFKMTERLCDRPSFPYDYEEDPAAQTIDLDQRRQLYSTIKFKHSNSRMNKAETTLSGVSFKQNGKIDVRESIEIIDRTPISKFDQRRDSRLTTSGMNRYESYRSIQHEPSNKKQFDHASKSTYTIMNKQKERFSSPKPERKDDTENEEIYIPHAAVKPALIKSVSRNTGFEGRSQHHTRSVIDYEENSYNVMTMKEKGYVLDTMPIRAGCFSPDGMYFAIGTNSMWLKICSLTDIFESLKPERETGDLISTRDNQEIPIVFDQWNHHQGSIYWIDWSENERLIATGSNDKLIKLLVNPLLQESDRSNILELSLTGHKAKVRTVCFHPVDQNVILSGGNGDDEIMIWDTETGQKTGDLAGHEGGTFWIKPSHDNTLFTSVGKDRCLKLWDLRNKDPLSSIDMSMFGDPNSIDINPEFLDINVINAAVSHECGKISYWDLNTGKPLNSTEPHTEAVKDLSFSCDGKYLSTVSFDKTLKMLNSDLEVIRTLEHHNKVLSVQWHPFLPFLLSTSADKYAKIWIPSIDEE